MFPITFFFVSQKKRSAANCLSHKQCHPSLLTTKVFRIWCKIIFKAISRPHGKIHIPGTCPQYAPVTLGLTVNEFSQFNGLAFGQVGKFCSQRNCVPRNSLQANRLFYSLHTVLYFNQRRNYVSESLTCANKTCILFKKYQ